MSDITKCTGEKDGKVCPLRDTCYRYTAEADRMQSWLIEAPFTKKGRCDRYWCDHDD